MLSRRFLFVGFPILFVHIAVSAQDLPDPYPANVKVNYIRTWTATAPEVDPALLIILEKNIEIRLIIQAGVLR